MRRLCLLLATAASLLLLPAPAGAAQTVYTCDFTGSTAELTPPVPSLADDLSTDVEQGDWTLGGGVDCAVTPPASTIQSGTIQGSGRYTNHLCGTGQFVGRISLLLFPGTEVTADAILDVTNGSGLIHLRNVADSSGATGDGEGVAQWHQNFLIACATTGLRRFWLRGTFALALD